MSPLTKWPKYRGEPEGTNGFILFPVFCMALGLLFTPPVNATETGIRGTMLWGPVIAGPARIGQSDEEPLSATFVIFVADHKVASFSSDQKGNFEVRLPAGDYTIVPDESTPIRAPQSQAKSVTVPVNGFAKVILRFDTGMR